MKSSPDKKLRLGFIGGGVGSAIGRTHWSASQMDGFWEVVSGCFSRDPDKSKSSAEFYRIDPSRAYSNWKLFLEKEADHLDAVAILLDSPQHSEIVIELLKRSVPVICEKPLCMTSKEVDQISREFYASSNFLAVTFNYSGYPMLRKLKAKINAGELGEFRHIILEMPQDSYMRNQKAIQGWRQRDHEIPMICLDLGTHLYHLIQFLVSKEPNRVCADFGQDAGLGVVDKAQFLFGFEGGATGSMWITKTSSGDRNNLKVKVIGSKATAAWEQFKAEDLSWSSANGDREIMDRALPDSETDLSFYHRMKPGHPSGFIEAFANLYADIAFGLVQFKATSKYDSSFLCGLEESKAGLIFFEAAVKSFETKAWVQIKP